MVNTGYIEVSIGTSLNHRLILVLISGKESLVNNTCDATVCISNIIQLSLVNMGLIGTLPETMDLLPSLVNLTITHNPSLSGTIPQSVGLLSMLTNYYVFVVPPMISADYLFLRCNEVIHGACVYCL